MCFTTPGWSSSDWSPSASLPPSDHIFMDNHIVYALVLLSIAVVGSGNTLGIGNWWTSTSLVRRFPWLT